MFDLEKDPEEMTNLAEDVAYQEKVKTLFSDLIDLQEEMDDELDLRWMLAAL